VHFQLKVSVAEHCQGAMLRSVLRPVVFYITKKSVLFKAQLVETAAALEPDDIREASRIRDDDVIAAGALDELDAGEQRRRVEVESAGLDHPQNIDAAASSVLAHRCPCHQPAVIGEGCHARCFLSAKGEGVERVKVLTCCSSLNLKIDAAIDSLCLA
jgi:hypothetical protein